MAKANENQADQPLETAQDSNVSESIDLMEAMSKEVDQTKIEPILNIEKELDTTQRQEGHLPDIVEGPRVERVADNSGPSTSTGGSSGGVKRQLPKQKATGGVQQTKNQVMIRKLLNTERTYLVKKVGPEKNMYLIRHAPDGPPSNGQVRPKYIVKAVLPHILNPARNKAKLLINTKQVKEDPKNNHREGDESHKVDSETCRKSNQTNESRSGMNDEKSAPEQTKLIEGKENVE